MNQATAQLWANQVARLQQELNGLVQKGDALAKQYYDAGFAELEATGYPRNLSDELPLRTSPAGVGFNAAIAAYRTAQTTLEARGGGY